MRAVEEEQADPRPHRIELPHVAEVAETRQPRAARAEHGQRHARIEACRGKPGGPLAHQQHDDDGREQRAARHQGAGRPDVGKVAEGAGERARDEAELDGDGESSAAAGAEIPLALEGGQHRGGAEPQAEREELGQRQRAELPPALAHAYSTTFFSRRTAMSVADRPRSFSTRSVCSPASGAADRTLPGVSESLIAIPTWRTRPWVGCSASTIICRWLICGSRTISSTS